MILPVWSFCLTKHHQQVSHGKHDEDAAAQKTECKPQCRARCMGIPSKRLELWQVPRRPWIMGAIVTVAASCRDTSVDVSVSVKLAHFCEALHQPGNPSLPPNTSYEPEQRGHCAAGRERAGSLYQANSSNAGAPFQSKVIPQACPWRGSDEKKVRTWMVLGVVEVYCGYEGEDSHRDLEGSKLDKAMRGDQ